MNPLLRKDRYDLLNIFIFILEYYKSRSSEVENYIKKEKLDVKNPLELVLLVGLMNSNQDVIDIKN